MSEDSFFKAISKSEESSFMDNDLTYELLLSNGFPIVRKEGFIELITAHTDYHDEIFTFVDIETNGSNPATSSIIELGAIKILNGEIIETFDKLVYCKNIPPYITKITGISQKDLEFAQPEKQVLKEFKLFLEDAVFVAHNVTFDYNFISKKMEMYELGKLNNRRLCTIDLAKKTIDSPKYGLDFLNQYLSINNETIHRAYSDAKTSMNIFNISLQNIPNKVVTTEDLIRFSHEG